MLGVVGFGHAAWAASYFPHDLPADWRLAYLANDCDCLVLPPASWCDQGGAAASLRADAVEEAPRTLRLFLQLPPDRIPPAACFAPFAELSPTLLVQKQVPLPLDWPQWCADGADQWVDAAGRRLVRWQVDEVDLRDWRARAERLASDVRALVLDGPAGSPSALRDLRIMLQIMGVA
jgi:hypothetical protein